LRRQDRRFSLRLHMKITKAQLKKIILEELAGLTGIELNTDVFKEADYATHAAERGAYMDPPQSLRFGKGVASSKSSTEGDDFPNWSYISKALNIIFEKLSLLHNSSKAFQLDKELLNLIYVLRTFMKNNSQIGLREVEYRIAEDLWKSTMNMAEYILEHAPKSILISKPQIFDKIMELAEFVRDVSGARWGSMSVGYSLQGQEKDLIIPQELKPQEPR